MFTNFVAWLLFLVLVCLQQQHDVVFVSGGVIRCIHREREALLAFKRGFTDDLDLLSSWGSEDEKKECCDWYGVECSNTTGFVIHLQLSDVSSEYRGQTSRALLQLHHLNYLDLSSIDFGGNRLPEFMGSMKSLRYLALYKCNMSGIVPQQLGNLTNLEKLYLSENSLRFENLNWLSHMSSLRILDLSGNDIIDTSWPQHILMLPSLEVLALSGCELRDGTPSHNMLLNSSSTSLSSVHLSFNNLSIATLDWLFNIKSLVHVDVSYNQLDGFIPDSFKSSTFLEHLDLSSNNIKGAIPPSLWNVSHLHWLDLSNNNLRELHWGSMGNLSCRGLETIFLSNNQLGGSVPDFSSCVRLERLDLQDNRLEYLPTSFGHLGKLEDLDVSNNSLKGMISTITFMNLHNLVSLDLSSNQALQMSPDWNPPSQLKILSLESVRLGPQFPTWIQVLRNLTDLDISYTGISDEAPNWIWNFSSVLSSLKLSNNKIGGIIPEVSIFSKEIQFLHMSHNDFFGSITSICNMPNLSELEMSYNHFSGEIPNCWKNLSELRDLNLAGNYFSGEIPSSLGSVENLESLQLNDNYFTGELPSTLKNCTNLLLLDVGGNMLTGNIPKWIDSFYDMMCLIFNKNRFVGNIPQNICNLTHIQVLDLSRNNLSGKIHRCFKNFTSLIEETTSVRRQFDASYSEYGGSSVSVFSISYYASSSISVQWKRNEATYQKNLGLLKLIDLSSNKLNGNIPRELFELKGLISLNLSRNSLEGSIPPNVGEMKMLDSLDLSRNHLSGPIPVSLAQLHYLQVLDLSNNILSGKIPTSTQLQSFNESTYVGNAQLCGPPLALCSGDEATPPASEPIEDNEERNWFMKLSLMQDLCISMAFGFIFGFWGFIGSLVVKRSWRIVYFNFFGDIGDWMYVTTAEFLAKFRRG